jgi:hypothetical protein
MRFNYSFPLMCSLLRLGFGLALVPITTEVARAHPYASGVTNSNGTIQFILNEDGATVYVVFEDQSTNALGVLDKGQQSFPLGAHTSYAIYVTKLGNGTPVQISSDTYTNSIWSTPGGVAANQNPKIGNLFGRIYAASRAFGPTNANYKAIGLYAFNADQTDAIGIGTNAVGAAWFTGSQGSGPWRMRVAPDNTLLVCDFSTPQAALWQYLPDLSNSNLVLAIIGQDAAAAAGIHGDMIGTPLMTGSLAQSNLVLWTADSGMATPAGTTLGPGTSVGSYNCLFRYDIGAGPLPWSNAPNYAYTLGLDGIPELRTEIDLGKDGKIIGGFGRANFSNPNLQILDPTGTTLLYTSGVNPPANTQPSSDPWAGNNGSGQNVGTYAGVRVSPDGRFLASVDNFDGITLANLTNGIPDDSSIFGIQNAPNGSRSRGMCWDAADNLYVMSQNQGLMRIYSLGISTTCITSNDFTGTNGTFVLNMPSLTASVVATTPQASQNYGTPIAGVFTITLNTNALAAPLTVGFSHSGTAAYSDHYSINTNEMPNGVIISTNSVTFPAGTYPGAGNWSVNVTITPTAVPVATNTLSVVLQLRGGAGYVATAPLKDTVYIQNTGPQTLLLTAATSGSTMYRGVTNDYAKFIITRLGDTNGPGNSLGSITPRSFTVTNLTYLGSAVLGTDFTAGAQRIDPGGTGVIQPPVAGPTAIVFNPGDSVVTCVVGDPVSHTNLNLLPTNLTVVIDLTNAVTGVTNTSSEGFEYIVGTDSITLTELDNAIGPEVVLWSNPLTNAADSVNWTLTFAGTNFGPGNLPVVVPNYVNDATSIGGGGTNDFLARFGYPIANDNVGPSVAMVANGWTNALKMTVNKNNTFSAAGVNVYPQGESFLGNYALRFNMYLSLYDFAINNPVIGTPSREFALFGLNHHGTNCNWRTDSASQAAGGMMPTNSDGIWFCIDAGAGAITPADFDAILPRPLPNNANPGALNDLVSNNSDSQNGVFKHPPFDAMNVTIPRVANPGGGEPVNKWVDVSVEITSQTNVNLFINRSPVLSSFSLVNGSLATSYTNGTILLGYDDPNQDVSDNTAFVYFSNVRVVELSPYILVQPGLTNSLTNNLLVAQFSSLTFTNSATFATAPITNTWYKGQGTIGGVVIGSPTEPLQTNSFNGTNMTDSLTWTFNNAADGTNYLSVFSDPAGSVTSTVVAVTVVLGPTNSSYNSGVTGNLLAVVAGPSPATGIQWYFNTQSNLSTATALTNSSHYAGVTASSLWITNIAAGDAGLYWCAVTNAAGFVVPEAATLTVLSSGGGAVVTPAAQTNLWGSTAQFTVTASGTGPFTYQWERNGTNLVDGGNISGVTSNILTLTAITGAEGGSYTAGVTNSSGGGLSTAGVLTIAVPPPTIANVMLSGTNVNLSITSTNSFDTTNAFILQSSPVVTGPYTNTPAIFSGSAGTFQVTVPQAGDIMFYRLLHAN